MNPFRISWRTSAPLAQPPPPPPPAAALTTVTPAPPAVDNTSPTDLLRAQLQSPAAVVAGRSEHHAHRAGGGRPHGGQMLPPTMAEEPIGLAPAHSHSVSMVPATPKATHCSVLLSPRACAGVDAAAQQPSLHYRMDRMSGDDIDDDGDVDDGDIIIQSQAEVQSAAAAMAAPQPQPVSFPATPLQQEVSHDHHRNHGDQCQTNRGAMDILRTPPNEVRDGKLTADANASHSYHAPMPPPPPRRLLQKIRDEVDDAGDKIVYGQSTLREVAGTVTLPTSADGNRHGNVLLLRCGAGGNLHQESEGEDDGVGADAVEDAPRFDHDDSTSEVEAEEEDGEEAADDDDAEEKEGDADVSVPEAAAYVERRPVSADLLALQRALQQHQSERQRQKRQAAALDHSAARQAEEEEGRGGVFDPSQPPNARLCSLVLHNGSLGYAWLDRSHVLVCGQTAKTSLWVGARGWGNSNTANKSSHGAKSAAGGFKGQGVGGGGAKLACVLPFFGLKRASPPPSTLQPNNNTAAAARDAADDTDNANNRSEMLLYNEGANPLDRTIATDDRRGDSVGYADAVAAAESGSGGADGGVNDRPFVRPHIPSRLLPPPASSSATALLPKSIAVAVHDAALLDSAVSILVQVGMDALPRRLWCAGGGGGGEDADAEEAVAAGEEETDEAEEAVREALASALPFPSSAALGYSTSLPAVIHVVFPTGADGNTTAFISEAVQRAEAELKTVIGTQLALRRQSDEARRRKRQRPTTTATAGGEGSETQSADHIGASSLSAIDPMLIDLAIASYVPRFEMYFTPRAVYTSTSARSSLQHLWPDVGITSWACRLDLTDEAMVLSVAAALHHVIGMNSAAAATASPPPQSNAGSSGRGGGAFRGGRGVGIRGGGGRGTDGAMQHTAISSRVDALAINMNQSINNNQLINTSTATHHGGEEGVTPFRAETFLVADVVPHPGSGHFMQVDAGTFDSLQIFRVDAHPSAIYNIGAAKEGLSLYFLIARRAMSPLGKELLRQWLAMPTCDGPTLTRRLDQVSFFAHVLSNGGMQVPSNTNNTNNHNAAGGPTRAPSVDLIGYLNKLLRRVQHPDYLINRVRMQRHAASDYRALLLATTALLDVCLLLQPFAELLPAARDLIAKCHPDAARKLIERISTTIDLEQCGGGGGGGGSGGGKGKKGVASAAADANNERVRFARLSGANAPILRHVSPQLDQLRDCYNSIDFDAFLAAAARKELAQLPPFYSARWKVSVAFMPHMGYLAVVDTDQVRRGGEDGATGGVGRNPLFGLNGGEEDNDDEENGVPNNEEGNNASVQGVAGRGVGAMPSDINLPEGWEFVFQNTSQCFCRTPLTRELDANIGDLHIAIKEVSAQILTALDEDVLALSHCLSAVRHVAEIDACLALAKVAVEEGWSRPTLAENSPVLSTTSAETDESPVFAANSIQIAGGFHPLLSRATPHAVIPFNLNMTHTFAVSGGVGGKVGGRDNANWFTNGDGSTPRHRQKAPASDTARRGEGDTNGAPVRTVIESLSDDRRIVVLTGPHGSGKSICQRAIGIIAILAHCGSFVPAAHASVPLFMDRVVCIDASTPSTMTMAEGEGYIGGRQRGCAPGVSGPLFSSSSSSASASASIPQLQAHALCSSFGKELAAMCRALHSITNNSLLLVDEFGKGTLAADGVAILAAVLGELGENTPQRTAPPSSSLISTHASSTTMPFPTPPMCVFTTHYTEVFEKSLVSPQHIAWKHMAVLVLEDDGDGGEGDFANASGGLFFPGGGGGADQHSFYTVGSVRGPPSVLTAGNSPAAASSENGRRQAPHHPSAPQELKGGGGNAWSASGDHSPSRSMLPSVCTAMVVVPASAMRHPAAHNSSFIPHQMMYPQSPADTGYGGGAGGGLSPIAAAGGSRYGPSSPANTLFGYQNANQSLFNPFSPSVGGGGPSSRMLSPFSLQTNNSNSRGAGGGSVRGAGRGGQGSRRGAKSSSAPHNPHANHHQFQNNGPLSLFKPLSSASPFQFAPNRTNAVLQANASVIRQPQQPQHSFALALQHHQRLHDGLPINAYSPSAASSSGRAQQLIASVYASTGRRLASPNGMKYLGQSANMLNGNMSASINQHHSPMFEAREAQHPKNSLIAAAVGGRSGFDPIGFRHMDPTLQSPYQQQHDGVQRRGDGGGEGDDTSGGSDAHFNHDLHHSKAHNNLQSRVVYLYELESCCLEKMFRSALETARVAGVPPIILSRAAQILADIRASEEGNAAAVRANSAHSSSSSAGEITDGQQDRADDERGASVNNNRTAMPQPIAPPPPPPAVPLPSLSPLNNVRAESMASSCVSSFVAPSDFGALSTIRGDVHSTTTGGGFRGFVG